MANVSNKSLSKKFQHELRKLGIITILPSVIVFCMSLSFTGSSLEGSSADTAGWAFMFLGVGPMMFIVFPLFLIFLHDAKRAARLELKKTEETLYDDQTPDEDTNLALVYGIASLGLYSFYMCIPGLIHISKSKIKSKRRRTALIINGIAAAFLALIIFFVYVVEGLLENWVSSLSILYLLK